MNLKNVDKTIMMMVGLPRSGKSTIAKEISNKTGWPIVNPDSIRISLHGQRFWGPGEPMVWAIARIMTNALFDTGYRTIILDATNFNKKRRDEWVTVCLNIKYIVVNTSVKECIARAHANNMPDLEDIIIHMDEKFEPLNEYEKIHEIDINDIMSRDDRNCL